MTAILISANGWTLASFRDRNAGFAAAKAGLGKVAHAAAMSERKPNRPIEVCPSNPAVTP